MMDLEKILRELTLEEKAGLCSGRDFWHTKGVERLGIPSVMMCDGPHGLRKQRGEGDHLGINESIDATCFPTAAALSASFDRALIRTLGETLGEECQAEDVGMLLGPGLNIKRSPLCGRNFEYFSEDPYLAGQLAASYVNGLQGKGVVACVKHFAANSQETLRMSGNSKVDERTLHEIYLPAFEAAVKEGGARSAMCAYNALNDTFCAENRELLTGILREKWGFSGFVVTDWGAVKDRVNGLLAGLDLEMPGGPGTQDAQIVEAVKSGRLEESVLDEAVRNVLQFVFDYQEQRHPEAAYPRDEHHKLAVSMEQACAVLLKNEGSLPLSGGQKVAFIGEFAQVPRYQGGGSSHINTSRTVSAVAAAEGRDVSFALGYRAHDAKPDEVLMAEAVQAAQKADVAVIFAGLPDAFESEGADRATLAMPENQNALIAAVAAAQPNTVVVLHGGSPMEMPWLGGVKAVLTMYLGGEGVGEAAVALLYGEANPSGKLAETYPCRLAHNPSYLNFPGEEGTVEYREGVYVGYRYYDKKQMEVAFPFGHGLSYTTFAYRDLTVSRESLTDSETLTVTCKVKNTGGCPGREVVQLYVGDVESTVGRPVRELKGFEKVLLEPGEEKTVSFTLDKRSFAYYEPKIHDWFVESGAFTIEIGASSRDIRLSGTVDVTGTVELPVAYTAYSPIGSLNKTARGRAVLAEILKSVSGQREGLFSAGSMENLGEGAEAIAQSMMREMPLSGMVTFGAITQQQLDEMLKQLQ